MPESTDTGALYTPQGLCSCSQCANAICTPPAPAEVHQGHHLASGADHGTSFSNTASNIAIWPPPLINQADVSAHAQSQAPPPYAAAGIHAFPGPAAARWPPALSANEAHGQSQDLPAYSIRDAQPAYHANASTDPSAATWPAHLQGDGFPAPPPLYNEVFAPYAGGSNAPALANVSYTGDPSTSNHSYSQWQVPMFMPVILDSQISVVEGEERTYYIVTRIRL